MTKDDGVRSEMAARFSALLITVLMNGGACGSVKATATLDGGSPDAAIPDADIDAGSCSSSVDLTTDGNNCGVCGHSCGGGACVAATCQPVTLAMGQNAPQGLAVDAVNLYWTTTDGFVRKLPKTAGPSDTPAILAQGQTSPFGIAVDDTHVYWVNNISSGMVLSVPINVAQSTPLQLATQQSNPRALLVASGFVYYLTDTTPFAISKVPSFGGGVAPLGVVINEGHLNDLTIDAATSTLYWTTSNGAVSYRPLADGGAIASVVQNRDDPLSVRIHNGTVFWTEDTTGDNVFKAAPGANATAVPLASATGPTGLAVDDDFVYWAESSQIMRVSIAGGQAKAIAANQSSPTAVVVDATSIYWVNASVSGTVMKLAK